MLDDLPEPFATGLAEGRPAEVCDLEAGSPEARFARGLARLEVGREADARADFEAVLPILGDRVRIELAMLDIRQRTDLKGALAAATKILRSDPESDLLRARVLHVVGVAQGKLRKTSEAALALLSSLEIYRDRGERLGAAQVRDTLGTLYASTGRLDLAVHYYALSLVDKTLGRDRYGVALTLGNLGRLHLRAGQFAEALDCFKLDLEQAEQLGDSRGRARMLEDIGRALMGLENFEGAEQSLRGCLESALEFAYPDLEFFARKDLALVLIRMDRLPEAERELEAAEAGVAETGEPYLKAVLLATRGELLVAKDDPTAPRLLEQAVRQFAAEDLPDYEIPTLLSLADVLGGRHHLESAQICLRRAMNLARSDGYARYLPAIREATGRLALVEGAVEEEGRLEILDDRPVTTDGSYTILRKLGSGAFGDVYYALDHVRNVFVAIKRMRLGQIYDGAVLHRMRTSARIELEAASQIHHAGISRVYAIGTDSSDETYIVQEYIDGDSLRALLPGDASAEWPEVVEVVRDIALSLAVLHEQGVVHRDLKPENVLLRAADRSPVLVDFGVARLPKDALGEEPGLVVGTLEYLAPEQAAGEEVDGAADVYSLGVLLFEWLCGEPPIRPRDGEVSELLDAVMQTPAASALNYRDDLPEELVRLLESMLAKDVASRPDASGVGKACRRLLEHARS